MVPKQSKLYNVLYLKGRGGVDDTRLEAKAKDTKKSEAKAKDKNARGQGQGPMTQMRVFSSEKRS